MCKETQALYGVFGGVAQLGEHLPCKQGVRGSNPLISTNHLKNQMVNMYIENFIQTNEIINRNFNYKPLIINKTSR